jgi:hypothetical protein
MIFCIVIRIHLRGVFLRCPSFGWALRWSTGSDCFAFLAFYDENAFHGHMSLCQHYRAFPYSFFVSQSNCSGASIGLVLKCDKQTCISEYD